MPRRLSMSSALANAAPCRCQSPHMLPDWSNTATTRRLPVRCWTCRKLDGSPVMTPRTCTRPPLVAVRTFDGSTLPSNCVSRCATPRAPLTSGNLRPVRLVYSSFDTASHSAADPVKYSSRLRSALGNVDGSTVLNGSPLYCGGVVGGGALPSPLPLAYPMPPPCRPGMPGMSPGLCFAVGNVSTQSRQSNSTASVSGASANSTANVFSTSTVGWLGCVTPRRTRFVSGAPFQRRSRCGSRRPGCVETSRQMYPASHCNGSVAPSAAPLPRVGE